MHLRASWKDGDVVAAHFPMSLWANPLNDYHADYNATIACAAPLWPEVGFWSLSGVQLRGGPLGVRGWT